MEKHYTEDLENYCTFEVGDRFYALFMGYKNVYRVKEIKLAKVLYGDDEIRIEPIIITKSGLVWSTHISGNLLDFYGRGGADYTPSSAPKTWIGSYYKIEKNEIAECDYAIGEE